ncbi:hypothetical protein EGT86_11755 [Burkholderia pseudomallei]|nr:hypothetical protein EGT86_11755 [Burkholderia pseudomallei]
MTSGTELAAIAALSLPASIAVAGERTSIRFVEFLASAIRNLHTRRAYARAVGGFLIWCSDVGMPSVAAVQPSVCGIGR